jgi:hypothetical protein
MKKLLFLCACALTYSSAALSFSFKETISSFSFKDQIVKLAPYAGIEAQMRHNRTQAAFGGNIFSKQQPQANLFLGVNLSDSVCLEFGRKLSAKQTRISSLGGGQAVGMPVGYPPAVHRGTTKFKDWHAEVIGLIPVYKQDCVAFLTSIGLARANIIARDKLVQNNFGAMPPVAFLDSVGNRTFHKKKLLLTAGVGLQAAVDEKTYLRARINWENYSRFKSITAHERADAVLKPKNNFVYSVGVAFKFF